MSAQDLSKTKPPKQSFASRIFDQFRDKLLGAVVAGIISGLIAAIVAVWGLLQSIPGPIGLVPNGAVIAFDLENGCPGGWSDFREAQGRFIIGAVSADALGRIPGDFRVDSRNNNLAERPFRRPGGAQTHQLTVDEMPRHNHGGNTGGSSTGPLMQYGTTGYAVSGSNPFSTVDHSHAINMDGGDQAHPIMPPYVALHYCRKN